MEFPIATPEIKAKQEKLHLAALLDAHQVPHHTWTEQKTLDDLAAEVRAGESLLLVDNEGQLCRHTAVAWVDVFSINEQGERVHLKEARQVFNDGRPPRARTKLPASLGEKLLVGNEDSEIPSEGAKRALAEELGIEQAGRTIQRMGTAQRKLEAFSYPGLVNIYTDHFFTVNVPFAPEGYKEEQTHKTTYFEWEPAPTLSEERLNEVVNRIRSILPEFASNLIVEYQDLSDPANIGFASDPDDPLHHSPSWHQYGILTHSEKFRESLETIVPEFLKQWGINEIVSTALQEAIDGVSKSSLLQIAALTHDLGKFTARHTTPTRSGKIKAHFTDHEAHSGAIIRLGLAESLSNLGCTDAQIEYIARCAELHFELGKVRRAAKESGAGFTLAFAHSKEGESAMRDIITQYPDYALEIGLMFIADSHSKADVYATADTDAGIVAQKESLEAQLCERGLHPNLIKQALQLPANLEVAKQYLTLWTTTRR